MRAAVVAPLAVAGGAGMSTVALAVLTTIAIRTPRSRRVPGKPRPRRPMRDLSLIVVFGSDGFVAGNGWLGLMSASRGLEGSRPGERSFARWTCAPCRLPP